MLGEGRGGVICKDVTAASKVQFFVFREEVADAHEPGTDRQTHARTDAHQMDC